MKIFCIQFVDRSIMFFLNLSIFFIMNEIDDLTSLSINLKYKSIVFFYNDDFLIDEFEFYDKSSIKMFMSRLTLKFND